MSSRHLAKEQPDSFAFSRQGEKKVKYWIAKYPKGKQRSAVIPMLWIAQKDHDGWIPEAAMRVIGDRLDMAYIRVMEVATFYTMFNLEPVGKHLIQVCGTTPCMLRGSGDLIKVCQSRIGSAGSVSADGNFSWMEVECLGACVNAPMVQISNSDGDLYYEDLGETSMNALLDELASGKAAMPGPRVTRDHSAPQGDVLTLVDKALYDGSRGKPLKSIPNAPAKPKAKTSKKPAAAKKAAPKRAAAKKAVAKPASDKPRLMKKARKGGPDDLKRISGVGPKIEGILHELGVFHYDQIAGWTKGQVDWADERLKFKGRIVREKWVAQAKKLAKEGGK
ncbi:MAG: NADH-quinone oxidoreductase subunit NuoE [Robiginitomaculum sp.]|nr:MAG: NADH-quinone oxidoreductase subunit NuoE [Robiginitomaculum sp.]